MTEIEGNGLKEWRMYLLNGKLAAFYVGKRKTFRGMDEHIFLFEPNQDFLKNSLKGITNFYNVKPSDIILGRGIVEIYLLEGTFSVDRGVVKTNGDYNGISMSFEGGFHFESKKRVLDGLKHKNLERIKY